MSLKSVMGLFLVLLVSVALTYFLLLLVYRAYTGKGRKKDGGLLPPMVMKGFIAVYGVLAVIAIIISIRRDSLSGILVSVLNIWIALGVYGIVWRREKMKRNG